MWRQRPQCIREIEENVDRCGTRYHRRVRQLPLKIEDGTVTDEEEHSRNALKCHGNLPPEHLNVDGGPGWVQHSAAIRKEQRDGKRAEVSWIRVRHRWCLHAPHPQRKVAQALRVY
jgi:hypothetical protein